MLDKKTKSSIHSLFASILVLVLASCASSTPPPVPQEQPRTVELVRAQGTVEQPLNISVVAFDTGLDRQGEESNRVFAPLRIAEARYLPFVLRETLVEAGHWGAVRVVPELDPTAEILVSAEILMSNGIELQLAVRAWDSRGRQWINRIYKDLAIDHAYDYDIDSNVEPFQDLFNEIANDLYRVRQKQSTKDLSNILDTSMLRYAVALSPRAFGEFLEVNDEGLIEMSGLPARDDVMYVRAKSIRDSEYEFIDIMDEQFENFYKKMRQTYSYWRQYSYELIIYNNKIEHESASGGRRRRGSWSDLDDVYRAYKESKMNEDELRELASSFDSEITPTVTKLEGIVVKLTGSLESQYGEWRSLLQKIYAEERGSLECKGCF